jgi:2-keto-3-deoxy-L-rhamnonate aldolase RhmA
MNLKQKLQAGQPVLGTMLTECLSPELAPLLAAAGLDFFIIDTEHSPADLVQIEALARVARSAGVAPLVRITDNEYFLIARVLDCGAAGVVAPRIQSAAAAREVLAAVKYSPEGRRGFGMRGILTDYQKIPVPEAMARANQETVVVVQVESTEAVEDLHNTVLIPGVDATMVGPNDLSISMGIPGEFDNPKFLSTLQRIADSCQGSPVAAGIHFGDVSRLAKCREWGYRFIVYSTDMALMLNSLREGLARLGEGASHPPQGPY